MSAAPPKRNSHLIIVAVCGFPVVALVVLGLMPFFGESVVTYDAMRRTRDGETVIVSEGPVEALPGDRYGFRVSARRPLWVYAFAVDGKGREHTIFPMRAASNPLAADETHDLPDDWLWEDFGDAVIVFVYMSEEPIEEVEYLATILPAPDEPPAETVRDGATAIKAHMTLHRRLDRRAGVLARRYGLRAVEE